MQTATKENLYRKDFPIISREIKPGVPLIYLDSAATSQKPEVVIQAMDQYYRWTNANIHRGVHTLAEEATAQYEASREKVARFIGANKTREVIFTRNTTESINLVAYSWGRKFLNEGDLVVLTEMEHHSNLVPWHMLAAEKGIRLEFIHVDDHGELDQESYLKLLDQHPKLVSFTHVSNVLGTINPAKKMTEQAHAAGAVVLVDGAQSAPHMSVDVSDLGADFFAFSAHKMLGPTGIGVLWGREALLDAMPPFLGGGDMIRRVYLRSFVPNELPYKFEAGTSAIAEAIGFGAAIDYLNSVGMEIISSLEHDLVCYALERLGTVKGLHLLGPEAKKRGGVTAFTLEGVHPHDVAQVLDADGIAVRAGHHCAMPLHDRFSLPATTRASYYLYNTRSEIDQLVISLEKVNKLFN
ncbi:MAG: cysteine desulfurase [Anaerolineaceae bacterium]